MRSEFLYVCAKLLKILEILSMKCATHSRETTILLFCGINWKVFLIELKLIYLILESISKENDKQSIFLYIHCKQVGQKNGSISKNSSRNKYLKHRLLRTRQKRYVPLYCLFKGGFVQYLFT